MDAILAEHVWEHLDPGQGLAAARNCFVYLKPGGRVRAAVPDGLHPDPAYRAHVRPRAPGEESGDPDHRVLYDHRSFAALFEGAGFEVELLEYHDESGRFHEVEWSLEAGMIHRSRRFDQRNAGGKLAYTSVILDARKPRGGPSSTRHPA